LTLEQVKAHAWVNDELQLRKRHSIDEWEKIEVNEDELRQAVIGGHVANFRRTKNGTLLKLTPESEGAKYQELLKASEGVGRFLPPLIDVKQSTGNRVIVEMKDLTHNVDGACLMDVKMGIRTFTEEDAASKTLRTDLLQKMQKLDPSAATPEEVEKKGITKMRYLQFRELATTSSELGFRVDAVQLSDEVVHSEVPDAETLRASVTTTEKVREVMSAYMQGRVQLVRAFIPELKELRRTLEGCELFMRHVFMRTSILFVYSNVTNATSVHVIDLARVSDAGFRLTHRAAWEPGNQEDGYLTGLDNLIQTLEEIEKSLASREA
jgi:1D-myo-inositol-triphosphate 3-kinase